MRFLLYNIRYGTGGIPGRGPFQYFRPTRRRLNEIIAFMRTVNPDLIGLIEVDAGSYRSGRQNQARLIAESLGHRHVYCSKYAADSLVARLPILRNQGNAFIVREPRRQVRVHYFRRGVKRLILELELPECVIILVHLALRGKTRVHQLQELYHLIRHLTKPVIVAGDFNTFWGDHEIVLFQAALGLHSADPARRPTWPSWRPRRQLDFILHSSEVMVHRFEIPSVVLSDHLPLICDFAVRHRERSRAPAT